MALLLCALCTACGESHETDAGFDGDVRDAGTAVLCSVEGGCDELGLVCDTETSICVECLSAAHCGSSEVCILRRCEPPTPCMTSRTCPGLVCDRVRGVCAECASDIDCTPPTECVDGVCRVPAPRCGTTEECASLGLVCDPATGGCVECLTTANCSPGTRCNADLICVTICTSGADCADGVFCNGVETCDPTSGLGGGTGCRPAAEPACIGAVGCDEDSAACVVCDVGLADCDGDEANGCEVALTTDVTNCGACGNTCPGATAPNTLTACASSTCTATCVAGFGDCDGSLSNGCEASLTTSANCGACGSACTAGEACGDGTCIPATGMSLWLRADAITGLADGARVGTWTDSSGNARHARQATGVNRPNYRTGVINGRPAVFFDGTSSFMEIGSFPMFATPSSEVTVIIVFSVMDFASQRIVLSEQFMPCVDNFEIGYHTGDRFGANFGLHRGCSHAVVTRDVATGWGVYTTRVLATGTSPANVEIFVDGSRRAVLNTDAGWVNPGAYGTALNRLTIGVRDDITIPVLNDYHHGYIAEIMIYARAVSDPERVRIETYLRTKYATP